MPSGAQISLLPHLVKRQSVQTILQPLGDRAETKLDQERGEARLQHLLLRTKIILHPSVAISTLTLPFFPADSGAQSDSELPSYHQNDVSLDRGYTSDSEVYADHCRPGKIHRSATDADVVNSGWLVVSEHMGSG